MKTKRIAIIGGGPSGLFMLKKLSESENLAFSVDVFEKKEILGAGMPYSFEGANEEHITNVSDNEIPDLATSIVDWIKTVPTSTLHKFGLDESSFHEYMVLPRLLFGQYLMDQFEAMVRIAKAKGISVHIHRNTTVTDIQDKADKGVVIVEINTSRRLEFDIVVICTGHYWKRTYEGIVPGFFDSPYPPQKLVGHRDHAVAIRGSSLTAIDAVRTLARESGTFSKEQNGKLVYKLNHESPNFRMIMHSRGGLLPAVRFHLEDSHLSKDLNLTSEEIAANRSVNEGFLSLDYVFDKIFKSALRSRSPEFYDKLCNLSIEQFVNQAMSLREEVEPFLLLKGEYVEAEKSIHRKESVHWKEMLAVLSFVMNYPAKYFSAEDTLRLQTVLSPLISVVIAFVPQSSCDELIALWEANILSLVAVGEESEVIAKEGGGVVYHFKSEIDKSIHEVHYETFVDSIGQPHLAYDEIPFKGLLSDVTLTQAKIRFRDPSAGKKQLESGDVKIDVDEKGFYNLKVPGVAINDCFQAVDRYGAFNERIYVMAVPFIGGFNPDYSGLDFCDAASTKIAAALFPAL